MAQEAGPSQIAEVLLIRAGAGVHLRHASDRSAPVGALRELAPEELREWAQWTREGAFRPNKFAPGLRSGWRTEAVDSVALETALEGLYPGAMADWYSLQQGTGLVTPFREFTARQTGMYRNTGHQSDPQAAALIQAGCSPRCCQRRRLWTVAGLAPDGPGEKSEIPCLEPCALLLEFARWTVRRDQDRPAPSVLDDHDLASLRAALTLALDHPDPLTREGDTSSPRNPRRLLLLMHKLSTTPSGSIRTKEV